MGGDHSLGPAGPHDTRTLGAAWRRVAKTSFRSWRLPQGSLENFGRGGGAPPPIDHPCLFGGRYVGNFEWRRRWSPSRERSTLPTQRPLAARRSRQEVPLAARLGRRGMPLHSLHRPSSHLCRYVRRLGPEPSLSWGERTLHLPQAAKASGSPACN